MIAQKLYILIVASLFSCQTHQKFDKVKWSKVGDLMTFPHRESMFDDLINNYPLTGKTYNELIDLLGRPQGKGDNDLEIFYNIDIDYGSDIDPIFYKNA
jgi:hypothetical protein